MGEKLHGVERNPGVCSVGARGGRKGLLRGAGAPAAAVCGGGDGPAVLGGGERVGENQWRARKVAAGAVGHEARRRRGLRGGLGGGSANGGGGSSGRRGKHGQALGVGRREG